MTVSILDSANIKYKYLDIKRTIYGINLPENDSEKISHSIVKAWNLLFLSRLVLQEVKINYLFKIFPKSFKSKNKTKKISEILKEKNENKH